MKRLLIAFALLLVRCTQSAPYYEPSRMIRYGVELVPIREPMRVDEGLAQVAPWWNDHLNVCAMSESDTPDFGLRVGPLDEGTGAEPDDVHSDLGYNPNSGEIYSCTVTISPLSDDPELAALHGLGHCLGFADNERPGYVMSRDPAEREAR